jgi:hypothetical protein
MAPTRLDWRVDVPEPVVRRLCRDFAALPPETVERCVHDIGLRGRHLGLDLDARLVEHVAREHLECRVKSEPPSARRAGDVRGE